MINKGNFVNIRSAFHFFVALRFGSLRTLGMKKFCCATIAAIGCLLGQCIAATAVHAARPSHIVLTAKSRKLMAHYASILAQVRAEVSRVLPKVDPGMIHPFMAAYRAEKKQTSYRLTNKAFLTAIAHCQNVAAPILSIENQLLSSPQYDDQLAEASIIAEATPTGLAAFAQQSREHEKLIHSLLSDPALMKQMLVAGGARQGNYGLTMEIYTTIEHACPLSHHGILQRLALATALIQHPTLMWQPFNPLGRYINFQNAYLKRELDPAFPTLTTWDCRFVVNDPFSNHEISWFRHMLMY